MREAAKRAIGQRQFDVQIVGGIAIHNRCIAELETGEGKTLVATMPAFLNALTGKGVHVVTVNDYLARRDAEWMGPIYQMLGLTVGCIQTGQSDPVRRAAYACDITYGTAKELGFDFLRDELKRLQLGGDAHRKTFEQVYLGQGGHVEWQMPVQRTHHFAIVDEADSILIDEARTPLIIGANNQPTQEEAAAYYGADQLAATLVRVKDYKYDPLERKAELTAAGRRKVQAVAANPAFVTLTVDGLYEYVERSLRAQIAYLKDRDYVAVDGEIVIVDEFTGRMMPGRQWQDGLHQAIQAKERLEITLETITAARVTVQDFFKRYNKLAGMTGTASSDAAELRRIYKVGVFKVPDQPSRASGSGCPTASSRPSDEGFQAVANQIVEWNKQGVPVLVGTRSIEKSERLSRVARGPGDRAPDLERQEPRDRGPDRVAGRPERPRDGRHQHGRPRNRHQARRRRRRAGRPARHRHRAPRGPADRPPARRPLRPPGRPGRRPVLHFAGRRDHRGLRRETRRPDPQAAARPGRADQRPRCGGCSSPPSERRNASTSAIASCSCTTRNNAPRCGRTWASTPCSAERARSARRRYDHTRDYFDLGSASRRSIRTKFTRSSSRLAHQLLGGFVDLVVELFE